MDKGKRNIIIFGSIMAVGLIIALIDIIFVSPKNAEEIIRG